MPTVSALRQAAIGLVFLITSVGALAMNKCMVNGTVTYQQTPCQTGKVQRDPTVEELNAEAKRRRAGAPASQGSAPTAPAAPAAAAPTASTASKGFSCDKRQYCSQMTSCAEAKFFLSHCPGVKMDGDKNGIPCEQQWCSR
jgi:hypothetical protein